MSAFSDSKAAEGTCEEGLACLSPCELRPWGPAQAWHLRGLGGIDDSARGKPLQVPGWLAVQGGKAAILSHSSPGGLPRRPL